MTGPERFEQLVRQYGIEPCGYCRGTGRVPGPQRDAYGPRPDYPAVVRCEYCDGLGSVRDGNKLFPKD
jgi:hypothetical protein